MRYLPTAVVAAALVGMAALLGAADRLPTGDATHLASATLAYADAILAGHPFYFVEWWARSVAPQPPLGFLPGVLTTLVLGGDWLAFVLPGIAALALVWDALRRLDAGNAWAAMLVVLASPMVWLYVEHYSWDLLCAAAVMQALSWLHRSDAFADRRAAVRFGLWTGIGVLTKYTFPFFVWLPALWALRGMRDPARRKNLSVAVGAAAALVAPWLLVNAGEFASYLGRSVGEGAEAAVDAGRAGSGRFTVAALSLYPLALKDALGWPGLLALAAGGLAGFRRVPTVGPLAALGGLVVLSSLEQSQDRYALPALVAASTLALGVPGLKWGLEVFVGVFGVLLAGSVATFRPGAPATSAPRFDHGPETAAALSWPRSRTYVPSRVDLDSWWVDGGLAALLEAHGSVGGTVGLLLPDDPTLPEPGVWLLRARLLGARWEMRLIRPRGPDAPRAGWPTADVETVLALWRPDRDLAANTWIAGTQRLVAHPLPGGVEAAILRR